MTSEDTHRTTVNPWDEAAAWTSAPHVRGSHAVRPRWSFRIPAPGALQIALMTPYAVWLGWLFVNAVRH